MKKLVPISLLLILFISPVNADFRVESLNHSVGSNEAILKLKQDTGFLCELTVKTARIEDGISSHVFEFEQEDVITLPGIKLKDGRHIERRGKIDIVLQRRASCLPEPDEDYINLKLRLQSELDYDLQSFGVIKPGDYIVNVERFETGERTKIGVLVVRGDDEGRITKVYLVK